jgi:AbrB family looped-hinge helix DNA binding protein
MLNDISTILTVSSKGWVVIPAELRKKYNLVPGTKVVIVDYGGMLAILPAFKNPVQQGYGLLKGGASLTEALQEDRELEKKAGRKIPKWIRRPLTFWIHLHSLPTFKANPPGRAFKGFFKKQGKTNAVCTYQSSKSGRYYTTSREPKAWQAPRILYSYFKNCPSKSCRRIMPPFLPPLISRRIMSGGPEFTQVTELAQVEWLRRKT